MYIYNYINATLNFVFVQLLQIPSIIKNYKALVFINKQDTNPRQ